MSESLGLSLRGAPFALGKATVLQAVGGADVSQAYAINKYGQSVGYSGSNAVLWSKSGAATVLQNPPGVLSSYALYVNASRWSLARRPPAAARDLVCQEAVLWSPLGKAMVLQDLDGQGYDRVSAINASRYSVGFTVTAGGGVEAVLWSPSGTATNLAAVLGPQWTNTGAVGINEQGDIVGSGVYDGGGYGFLLTPVSASPLSAAAVPEPST